MSHPPSLAIQISVLLSAFWLIYLTCVCMSLFIIIITYGAILITKITASLLQPWLWD